MLQGPTNSPQVQVASDLFPRPFGDFDLLKLLSTSATGESYIALRSEGVDRLCVVSVLAPELAGREDVMEALRAQAAWLVRRVHGSVVQIYDVGQADGSLFFASELVEGRDLATLLERAADRQDRVPIQASLALALDFADGIEFVRTNEHKATGVVTSWLSTSASSFLVASDGRGRLVHQGSCLAPSLDLLTDDETGRASLVAPEVARGEPASEPSDVFVVGALLWQMLTGKPLAGGAARAHLQAMRDSDWVAPQLTEALTGQAMPEALVAVVSKSLSSRPGERQGGLADLRTELAAVLKATDADGQEAAREMLAALFGREIAIEAAEITRMAAQVDALARGIEGGGRRSSVTLTNFEGRRRRTPVPVESDLALGEVIPGTRYRALAKLGEGGMGGVYCAEHIDIEKRVALKLLHADLLANPVVLQQFRQEARAASKIGNPYICDVTDWGEVADGRVFFVMEYIDGLSLSKTIKKARRLSPERCIPILRQVAKALGAAHEKSIVHLDVKPDNILLMTKDGRADAVKVVDFGIAGLLGQGGPGIKVMGTPEYMAPERTQGTGTDHRSDIYSLGIVAYEMLVGECPFQGPTPVETLAMHAMDAPDAPSERLTTPVPASLEAVILRMLSKDPSKRPQNMAEVEALLCEAQIDARIRTPWDTHLAIPAVGTERMLRLSSKLSGRARTRMALTAAGAVAAMAVVIAAVALTRGGEREAGADGVGSRESASSEPGSRPAERASVVAPAVTTPAVAPTVTHVEAQPPAEAKPASESKTATGPSLRRRREERGEDEGESKEVSALITHGTEALAAGRLELAKKDFNQALKVDGESAAVHAGLAEVFFEQARYDQAVEHARAAVKMSGRKPRARLLQLLGDSAYKLNLFDDAIAAYARAKVVAPGEANWDALIERVKAKRNN